MGTSMMKVNWTSISKPSMGKDTRECFILLVHLKMAVRDIDREIRVSYKG